MSCFVSKTPSCCGCTKGLSKSTGKPTRNRRTSSDVPGVIEKLRRMDQFKNACEHNVRHKAESLSDPVELVRLYFQPITQDLVQEQPEELANDKSQEVASSHEEQQHISECSHRGEGVARFQIKLMLRYANTQRMEPEIMGRQASLLHKEYGPLHASLIIDNRITLQWSDSSLIIPQTVDHKEVSAAVSASVDDIVLARGQGYKPQLYSEVELMFFAANQKVELIERLADVITRYNSKFIYHLIYRNCQDFVTDALVALGCQESLHFPVHLKEYFTHLKFKGVVEVEFETHGQLDVYIDKCHRHLTLANMEYFLAQYFLFHTKEMLRADMIGDWRCPLDQCMMSFLESSVGERPLLLHKYSRQHNLTH